MFGYLTESIAEIIYDRDMHNQGYTEWVKWEMLDPEVQEDFLKTAEEIIELIEEIV